MHKVVSQLFAESLDDLGVVVATFPSLEITLFTSPRLSAVKVSSVAVVVGLVGNSSFSKVSFLACT